jgi:hypothetical protein
MGTTVVLAREWRHAGASSRVSSSTAKPAAEASAELQQMTSAWLTGAGTRKKRFSSKLLVAASANSAAVMSATPATWKLGATATSPRQKSDTPATSSAAAAYSGAL